MRTHVNGELRQDDSSANLMFGFACLVNYLSTFTTLAPGNIIATGTPIIGAGIRFDPPKFLPLGDVVEIEVGGVGVLRNIVKAKSTGASALRVSGWWTVAARARPWPTHIAHGA